MIQKVLCPVGRSISTSNITLPAVINTVDLNSHSRLQEYSVIDIFNSDEAGMRHGVTARRLWSSRSNLSEGNSPLVLCNYEGDKRKDMLLLGRSSVPNYIKIVSLLVNGFFIRPKRLLRRTGKLTWS